MPPALVVACGSGARSPGASTTATAGAGGRGGAGGLDLGPGVGGAPSCDGGEADAWPEASPCDASADVSYAAEVRPILSACTGELCHGPFSYDTVVGQPSTECCGERLLVSPGDPAHSYLLDKLENHDLCAGARMPLGAPPLDPGKIQAIADWICAGALDD